MTTTGPKNPAIHAAWSQSLHGPRFDEGECLERVHDCFRIGPEFRTAIAAWRGAKHRHPETDPLAIPRGVPVFWSGGSHGYGHVAIGCGYRRGRCWSTDILRVGYFDHVDIALIHQKWGLTLLGWTEDLNGVMVRRP